MNLSLILAEILQVVGGRGITFNEQYCSYFLYDGRRPSLTIVKALESCEWESCCRITHTHLTRATLARSSGMILKDLKPRPSQATPPSPNIYGLGTYKSLWLRHTQQLQFKVKWIEWLCWFLCCFHSLVHTQGKNIYSYSFIYVLVASWWKALISKSLKKQRLYEEKGECNKV